MQILERQEGSYHRTYRFQGVMAGLMAAPIARQGYRLCPASSDSSQSICLAHVQDDMTSIIGDIRDLPLLTKVIKSHRPEIIIHLAAQALVGRSYRDPRETYVTNLMGTVNILEAVRQVGGVRVIVVMYQ